LRDTYNFRLHSMALSILNSGRTEESNNTGFRRQRGREREGEGERDRQRERETARQRERETKRERERESRRGRGEEGGQEEEKEVFLVLSCQSESSPPVLSGC